MKTLSRAERQWLDDVYRRYSDRVFTTCLRFAAGDRAWAWDRLQDVFVTLARNVGSVTDSDEPGGWLYRVAVNCCLSHLKRSRVRTLLLDRVVHAWRGTAASAAPALEARQQLNELERDLAALPPKQRAMIVLVYVEQRPQHEAAALLAISKGQASKLHARALARLRELGWQIEDPA